MVKVFTIATSAESSLGTQDGDILTTLIHTYLSNNPMMDVVSVHSTSNQYTTVITLLLKNK